MPENIVIKEEFLEKQNGGQMSKKTYLGVVHDYGEQQCCGFALWLLAPLFQTDLVESTPYLTSGKRIVSSKERE